MAREGLPKRLRNLLLISVCLFGFSHSGVKWVSQTLFQQTLFQHPQPAVLATPGMYGPNNQLLSHIFGIKLSAHCGIKYANMQINKHYAGGSQLKRLTEVLAAPTITDSESFSAEAAKNNNSCILSTQSDLTGEGSIDLMLKYMRLSLPEKTRNISFAERPSLQQLCSILKECKISYLLLPFRHFYMLEHMNQVSPLNKYKIDFSLDVKKAGKEMRRKMFDESTEFLCTFIRQHDSASPEKPFHNLPMFERMNITQDIDAITELARRHRSVIDRNSSTPVILVSKFPPSEDKCQILLSSGIHCCPPKTDVHEQQASCFEAFSISYVDDMKRQVGIGGGLSTIYEVLKYLGRNTEKDVPFSAIT